MTGSLQSQFNGTASTILPLALIATRAVKAYYAPRKLDGSSQAAILKQQVAAGCLLGVACLMWLVLR